MQTYLWIKTTHLVLIIAWMAAVFYLPRILINLNEAGNVPEVRTRRRLYRFGHIVFGFAIIAGLVLWLGWRWLPEFPATVGDRVGWLHLKLTLVAMLLAHFVVAGRWLKGVDGGHPLPSNRALRWFNELPLLVLVLVVWLVLGKPF